MCRDPLLSRGANFLLSSRRGLAETPDEFGYASPRLAKAIVTRMWHTQLILTRMGKGLFHCQESWMKHAKGIVDQPIDLDSFA